MDLEEAARHADAAGLVLVEEERRALGEGRAHLGDGLQVARVAHEEDGREVAQQVRHAPEAVLQLGAAEAIDGVLAEREPVAGGVAALLRDADLAPADVLVRVELDLLEDRRDVADGDLAVVHLAAAGGRALERLQHLEVDGEVGVGVVVDVDLADVGLLLVPVEAVDVVLLAAVHVDRLVVDQQRRGGPVDLADDARLRPLLDDDEVVDGGRCAG